MIDATKIPDAVFERLLLKTPPEALAAEVAELLAKRDHRLALVLVLALLAQHEGLPASLPALLRATAGAEALLRGEA
ncbi:MAG TPA: hypothetical protein PLP50_15660 [Thermoanaerobaculia bacterium]|jgi:hypothetical protein|nr:hypothetical protein [Thermoanaerobaculia bacterium]HQN09378.1 hypothetical protein [Thermoanaerobaculia bacterium]HQP88641.1 hypothetical protein [Thermoanaerobaculia bacterium]